MNFLIRLAFAGATLLSTAAVADTDKSHPDIAPCPTDFYSVAMPDDAMQCQKFDDEMPASLVFHSPNNQQQLITWYQNAMPDLTVVSRFNGRTVLSGASDNIRVVVSPDNQGAQVDLLIIDSLLAQQ